MQPTNVAEVQECLASAVTARRPLEIVGGGTKRYYGCPVIGAEVLDVRGISGIVEYEPRELILIARAATPLAELETALAAQGQMLAFEPPHWGAGATIGGTLACNLSGPRRFKAGAARDHLLGFQAVSGRGAVFRAGGRVVKNVTGYDLSKLMCGSFGTLAVLTEVCVKVLPRGETEATVAVLGLDGGQGMALLIAASQTPHEVSGLAYLPEGTARPAPLAALHAGSVTLLRVEGPAPSVAYRITELGKLVKGVRVEMLPEATSREVWRSVRELEPLPVNPGEALWRFSVPPTEAMRIRKAFVNQNALRGLADWGGALLWAVLPMSAHAPALFRAAQEAGGHARMVRAVPPLEGAAASFPEQSPARAKLHANLKAAFDPHGILNPGRMSAEW